MYGPPGQVAHLRQFLPFALGRKRTPELGETDE